MTSHSRLTARLLLALFLLPVVQGCEESEIPVIPEGPPRFTNVVITPGDAEPGFDETVSPGSMTFSVTAYYQQDWGEAFDVRLYIESWADDVWVRVERTQSLEVFDESGTVAFSGTVQVPNCGGIDQLSLFVGLYAADGDPVDWVDADWYFVDVSGASSTPC